MLVPPFMGYDKTLKITVVGLIFAELVNLVF